MERPNLELPQRVAVSRPIFDRRSGFFFACGLIAVAGLGWLGWRGRPAAMGGGGAAVEPGGVDAEALALRLEDKNLHNAAAEAWREHLRATRPAPEQAARLEVRIGKLLQRAGRHEEALAAFYRAEALAGGKADGLGDDLGMLIRESFQRMGRYSELAREVAQRASISGNPTGLTGQQIVAQIGDEKITRADFERMVQEEIESVIATMPGSSAARPDEVRRRVHEQYAQPQAQAQLLQHLVGRRVLAAEARRRKLDEDAAYRVRLAGEADSILSGQLTARIAQDRGGVTPEDVQRYFDANRSRYETAARGRLARIVCADEAAAREVVAALKGGAEFATLAKEKSIDPSAKETGGELEEPIGAKGERVPGVGADGALRARLWALEVGGVSEPCRVSGQWHVYKMMEKQAAHLPEFAAVRATVEADCAAARRDEVLQQYVKELFDSYRVRLNVEALATTQASG
ncbi:MAG: peptidyl-prolyl cis-trans isomerase [Phycisphaerae bacterium]